METKVANTGRLIRPGAQKSEPQAKQELGDLKVRSQTEKAQGQETSRADRREVQRTGDETRVQLGRVRDSARPESGRRNLRNSRGETQEQRAARKQREREVRARERVAREQERREEAEGQREFLEQKDELVNTLGARAIRNSIASRGQSSAEGLESGRALDPEAELGSRASLANRSEQQPASSSGPQSEVAASPGVEPRQETEVDLRRTVSRFADRTKNAQAAVLQDVFYFFANSQRPEVLDESEERTQNVLAEIEQLTPTEITPEVVLMLMQLGAISREALNRIEERLRDLGKHAPAGKEKVGAIAMHILKLMEQADQIAFDPRNN